jgi:hypothetical protein
MCPRTPSLSPEYSHKAGLQAVLTRMPLQTRPVTQRRARGARYNGPDHTWASEQDEAVLRGDVTAGLRLVLNEAKGVPARFVFVKPATAAKGDERRVASLPSPQQGRILSSRISRLLVNSFFAEYFPTNLTTSASTSLTKDAPSHPPSSTAKA